MDWQRLAGEFAAYLISLPKGRRKYAGSDRVRGHCPLPEHDDTHPSFSYWIEHDGWACSCGKGRGSELRKRLGYTAQFDGGLRSIDVYSYGKNRKVKFRKESGKSATWEHETDDGWTPGKDGDVACFGISEIGDAELVLMSESESDRNSLAELGFTAIATPHGANTPIGEADAKLLAGRRVALMEHQDEKGQGAKWSAICLPPLRKAGARPFVARPPKPHKDVRDFILSGAKKEQVQELLDADWLKRPGFVQASMLFKSIDDKIEYAIEPIFPKGGLIQLQGAPKQGKSTFGLACALQVAAGQWACGSFKVHKPYRAAYLSYEDNKRRIKRRSIEFSRGFGWGGAIPDEFMLWSTREPLLWLDDNPFASDIGLSLIESKVEVLFVDTFSYVHSSDENSASEMKLIMARLMELCQVLGLTVVYLHHSRKPSAGGDQAKTVERGRGSSAIAAAPDVILDWGSRIAENTTEFHMESKEDDAKTWNVLYEKGLDAQLDPQVRWEVAPAEKKSGKMDRLAEIKDAAEKLLIDHPNGFTRYHMADVIGISPSSTKDYLEILTSKGLLMRSLAGGGKGKVTLFKRPPESPPVNGK